MLCNGCDGCCVFCLYCEAWSCRCPMYGKCECFVMPLLYVCVLCASGGRSQCCILHDFPFVNAGQVSRGDHLKEAYSKFVLMIAV